MKNYLLYAVVFFALAGAYLAGYSHAGDKFLKRCAGDGKITLDAGALRAVIECRIERVAP